MPLLPFESCNLGSLNLAKFIIGTREPRIDWGHAVRVATRLLDDVVSVTRAPLPEIAGATAATRKLGLGVMGFAELLIRLGIRYDSDAAVRLAAPHAARGPREPAHLPHPRP